MNKEKTTTKVKSKPQSQTFKKTTASRKSRLTSKPSKLTKKSQLIRLLSREAGADITSISKKFGWQSHTTRAALSGLCKAGYEVSSMKAEAGMPTKYRITGASEAKSAMIDTDKIASRMSEQSELDRSGLRVAWQRAFDNAPPHFLSMLFMRKTLIWDALCKLYGGVPANLKRALKSAADGKTPRVVPAPTMRPGTQLIREWNGRRRQVDVTKDGFRYNGDTHKSLSAIALLITGTGQ